MAGRRAKSLPATVDADTALAVTQDEDGGWTYIDAEGRTRRVPERCVEAVDLMIETGVTLHAAGKVLGKDVSQYYSAHWFAAYMRARMSSELISGCVLAASQLIDLLKDSDPNIRLKAARELLDRGLGSGASQPGQALPRFQLDVHLS